MCGPGTPDGNCGAAKLKADPKQWEISGTPIGYCLARKTEPHCKLQFSRDILVVGIICNLCKAAAMVATLLLQHKPTLVTTGDAISSWLQYPDRLTANRCLQSAKTSPRRASSASLPAHNAASIDRWPPAVCYKSKTFRWHQAINRRRWATVLILCVLTLVIAGCLIGLALYSVHQEIHDIFQATGFGAASSSSMINLMPLTTGTSGLLANVLVANSPQLIFSCLYLLYNGIFTSMCLAHEYSKYSNCRKGLRATSPQGDQRSTYWLHLPYVYSIFLLAASALLHWSISQTIFLVGIDVYREQSFLSSNFGLGFSVQPIMLDIAVGKLHGNCTCGHGIPQASWQDSSCKQ